MRLDNISMDELSNQYEKEYTALYESSDEKMLMATVMRLKKV